MQQYRIKGIRYLRFFASILLIISIWLWTGLASAETNGFNAAKADLFLSVELPDSSLEGSSLEGEMTYSVLRWKEFRIQPKLVVTDENGATQLVPQTPACNWDVGDETVLRHLGDGQFYAIDQGSVTITCTCQYAVEEKVETYKATAIINVKKLTVDENNAETLSYAALSQLSYTHFGSLPVNSTVEDALKPDDFGQYNYSLSGNPYILKADYPYLSTTANVRDFITACAGDWLIKSQHNGSNGFSATVFENGSRIVIAYRGTEPQAGIDDIITDIALGAGCPEAKQFPQALSLYQSIRNSYKGKTIVLTGHSLGGGLANYVSLLTGARAVTFNAPSTVVTAVSNFINGASTDLLSGFTGLDDGLRTDYVNAHDWVGKVGVGDSLSDIVTGVSGITTSGNLDRTVFLSRNLNNEPGFPPNHDITRMINYLPGAEKLSLTGGVRSTYPNRIYSFHWFLNNATYYFGTTNSDTITTNHFSLQNPFKSSYVLSGNGNDDIQITVLTRQNTWHVLPGYGSDTIRDAHGVDVNYYTRADQGTDTIIDGGGQDRLYIYSSDAIELDYGYSGEKINVLNKTNGNAIIATLHLKGGLGSFTVFLNGVENKTFERTITRKAGFITRCPVDVEIYDANGVLVAAARNGSIGYGSGDYGSWQVYPYDNGYAKSVNITEPGYTIKIIGVGEGSMSYSANYETDEKTDGWQIEQIPVKAGSAFWPAMEYDSEFILQGDLDGDGIIDYNPWYVKAESITLPETLNMAYGETTTLTPVVLPANTSTAPDWTSDRPDIVTVDENGVLTANGFGTANICCAFNDGSGVMATTAVTVAEEVLSVEECEIVGLEDRYSYTGEPVEPEITVLFRGRELSMDRDYRINYEDCLMPGVATITIEGLEPFSGTLTTEYEIYLYVPSTVDEIVEKLAEQCGASGAESDYEIALWMHDWLTHNANYDYTYTEYYPDGVLLKGTGVCQSYALAYELLMDRMGIECMLVNSEEMNHAWNLIRIDGEWYHVDCTWDDPGIGGSENHAYFCLSDDLMARDHIWDRSRYPACNSSAYYHPILNGENCVDSLEALEALLAELAENQTEEFTIFYTGSDPDFMLMEQIQIWYSENNWRYGLINYSLHGTEYQMTVEITYGEPWDEPVLEEPVKAPDFALNSLNGCYKLSNYSSNGVVLIFGRDVCSNTLSFVSALRNEIRALKASGVEVLVSLDGKNHPSELKDISDEYPDINFVCDQGELVWEYMEAVGIPNASFTYPAVFVINSDGMITYYSTGYVSQMNAFLGQAYAVATHAPLPPTEPNVYQQGVASTGSISAISGTAADQLRSAAADSSVLLYVMDDALFYDTEEMLDDYEQNYAVYDKLGIRLAVSFEEETEASAFPHVEFIQYDNRFFWDILSASGMQFDDSLWSRCFYLIEPDGDIISYSNGYSIMLDPYSVAINMLNSKDCSFTTPQSLYYLEDSAFEGAAMDSVDLSGSLLYSIGSRAFANCDNLTLIKIPSTTTYIAPDAFEDSDDIVIFCDAGSAADRFADAHNIMCLSK